MFEFCIGCVKQDVDEKFSEIEDFMRETTDFYVKGAISNQI